jgi:hypothetical protein
MNCRIMVKILMHFGSSNNSTACSSKYRPSPPAINLPLYVTLGNFNMSCDDVDYSMAHILSYLVPGLNDQCSQFHYCLLLFWKNLFRKESTKKVVTWVDIRAVRGPVLSTCETIRKSVKSVMQKVQNSICCVRPGSILHEPLR